MLNHIYLYIILLFKHSYKAVYVFVNFDNKILYFYTRI